MTTTQPTPTRRRVDGWLVFALALLTSLVISWGPLSAAMRGEADILAAGTRYLVGLALSWAGIFGFAMLLTSYAATIPPDEIDDTDTSASGSSGFETPEEPLRRSSDAPAAAAPASVDGPPEGDTVGVLGTEVPPAE